MIREAARSDTASLMELIRGLAAYEREPDSVEATEADLARALFTEHPLVHALVAEDHGSVVGMAVWFLTFSTWTGQHTLYLEDLFVRPDHRFQGHGRALFTELARRAAALGCPRMEWSVLDWNEPAHRFYTSLGARPMDEWTTWRLAGAELRSLAGE